MAIFFKFWWFKKRGNGKWVCMTLQFDSVLWMGNTLNHNKESDKSKLTEEY